MLEKDGALNPWPQANEIFARFYRKSFSLHAFQEAIEPGVNIVSLKQVHGAEVVHISKENLRLLHEGDALFTDLDNVVLTVHTADCLPLLAYSKTVIGACHGGWKSLAKNILDPWINSMKRFCKQGDLLRVAIGPGIGPCHFEVGSDVAQQILSLVPPRDVGPMKLKHPNPDKVYIDLKQFAKYRLNRLGLEEAQITITEDCTYCSPEKYYSFRRDGDKKGQRLEAIIVKAHR